MNQWVKLGVSTSIIFSAFAYFDHRWHNNLYYDHVTTIRTKFPTIPQSWVEREIKRQQNYSNFNFIWKILYFPPEPHYECIEFKD